MHKKVIIKDVEGNLLKQFAEGIGKPWISKRGKLLQVTPYKRVVIDTQSAWIYLTTKPDERPKATLEKIGKRDKLEEYSFDELIKNSSPQSNDKKTVINEEYSDDEQFKDWAEDYNSPTSYLPGTVQTHTCDALKVDCDNCKGSGICPACDGSKVEPCSNCDGSGDCPNCYGSGYVDCYVCDGRGTCKECDGDGWVNCYICDGCGEVECSSCGGTGRFTTKRGWEVECKTCGGTGFVTCGRCHGRRTFTCSNCDGDGQCPQCEGRGDFYCRECDHHHNGNCNECHGKGSVKCSECNGKGKCKICKGEGKVNCPKCEGSGKYQTFTSVIMQKKLQVWHYESGHICGCKVSQFEGEYIVNQIWLKFNWDRKIEDNTERIQYVLKSLYPDSSFLEPLKIEEFFNDILANLKNSAHQPSNEKYYPYTYRMRIKVVDDILVSYNCGKKNYEFHIIGSNHEVLYDKKPSIGARFMTWVKKVF